MIRILFHVAITLALCAGTYFAKQALPRTVEVKTVVKTVPAECKKPKPIVIREPAKKCKPVIVRKPAKKCRDCAAATSAFKKKLDNTEVILSEAESRLRRCEIQLNIEGRAAKPWVKCGKKTYEDLEWFKDNLIDPYADEELERE